MSNAIPIKKLPKPIKSEESQNMSFSMIIDNKTLKQKLGCTPPEKDFISTKINTIYPKGTSKWLDSSIILNCQLCSIGFGLFYRKHHCRACGGVFCYSCCNKTIIIPQNFIQKPMEDNSLKQKVSNLTKWIITGKTDLVCNECFNKISNLKKITYIIKICEFLDLESLGQTLLISKNWHNSGIHQLSKFREIQYNYPIKLFTTWEKNMLWISRYSIIGHTNWLIVLIKSCIQLYYETNDKKILEEINILINENNKILSCWKTMCSRKCNMEYDILEYIELLKFISVLECTKQILWFDFELQNILLEFLKKIFVIEYESLFLNNNLEKKIKCAIPLLCSVFISLMNSKKINYVFVENIFNQFAFINNCLIDIIIETNYLENIVDKSIGLVNFINFMSGFSKKILEDKWKHDIDEMVLFFKNLIKSDMTNYILKNPIVYPIDINYKIIKINKKIILKSYTAPLLIEAVLLDEDGNEKNVRFIVKTDDSLRKERIIACLIKLLQDKLYEQSERNRIKKFEKIPAYEIIMITKNIGIIEFVEDSVTLRMVNSANITLQNYILDNNPKETTENVKRRFLQSLAISSCLSFMLGLGDRHLDNIMINKKGQLFQIDYGYLMDNPMTSILTAPNIKVTAVMIDFLGGTEGIYYKEFTEYIIQIYDIMRLYKNIIINHYELLGSENFINWSNLKEKLENRFMTGMTWKDIQVTLINEIQTSNSYSSVIGDLCHHYRQKIAEIISNK